VRREIQAGRPIFAFFIVGFLILLTLIKLILAQFSIEMTTLSTVLIGAFAAAKGAMLMDETSLAQRLERYPRIVAVAVKTFFYGLATVLLGYLERFLEALHHTRSFGGAVSFMIAHANHYRIMAVALGVSVLFALYFAFFEINRRMGGGALRALFLEWPVVSQRPSVPAP